MAEQLTILQEIRSLIKLIEKDIDGVAQSIAMVSKNAREAKGNFAFKTPKQVNEQLQKTAKLTDKVNIELREQQRLEKALATQIVRKEKALSDVNRKLIQERFETQQINKQVKEQVILQSKLSTFYQKQSVILNQLTRRRQSLLLKQNQGISLTKSETRELKALTRAQTKLDRAIKKTDTQVGRSFRNVGNYKSALSGLAGTVGTLVATFGVFGALQIGRTIFNEVKEIDALNKALLQVTESQEAFNNEQQFLIELADEAGVEINGLQKSYTKFLASAKTTNLSIEETRNIFRQTAKAGAVLGLSTDDLNGSFRALEQILSKGKVQAEEIRGQLGERLPGAFQILAGSMGLTTQELSKQLELGNVISEEVLPKFAEELEKVYGLDQVKKVDTLIAAQNRLSNEWNLFIRSIEEGEGVISQTFKTVITEISETIKWWRMLNDEVGGVNKSAYRNELEEIQKQAKRTGEEERDIALRRLEQRRSATKAAEEEIKQIKSKIESLEREQTLLEKTPISRISRRIKKEKESLILAKQKLAITEGQTRALVELIGTEKKEKQPGDVGNVNRELEKQVGIFQLLEQSTIDLKKQFSDLFIAGVIDLETYNRVLGKIDQSVKNITEGYGAIDQTLPQLTGIGMPDNLILQMKEVENALINLPWDEALREASTFFNALDGFAQTFFDREIQRYDDQIAANDLYYSRLLDNEELSVKQRDAIEAEQERKRQEIERRKREEQRKAAIVAKAFAATQIIINTAVEISKIGAQTGIFGIPLKALVAAEGALRLATVLAQPIPQFATGKDERDRYEGLMIWGEKRPEVRVSKSGEIDVATKPTLGYTKPGDTIFPSFEAFGKSDIYNQVIGMQIADQTRSLSGYQRNATAGEIERALSKMKPPVVHNHNSTKPINYNKLAKAVLIQKKADI